MVLRGGNIVNVSTERVGLRNNASFIGVVVVMDVEVGSCVCRVCNWHVTEYRSRDTDLPSAVHPFIGMAIGLVSRGI